MTQNFLMKALYCIGIFLIGGSLFIADGADNQNYNPSGGGWKKGDGRYDHKDAAFLEFSYSEKDGATNIYNYVVGTPGDGWSFIPEKTTFSGGVKKFDPTSDSSGIKTISDATKEPVSFTLSMGGELTKAGSGSGTVSWSATAKSNFFWLAPYQEKIISVTQDETQVTVTANGSDNEANWTLNGSEIAGTAGKTSVTLKLPESGKYTVAAEAIENSARRDSTVLYLVEFTQPCRNGLKEKYIDGSYRYDCQVVRSSNAISVLVEDAGRSDAEVQIAAGGVGGNITKLSHRYTYTPPATAGTDTIQLYFTDKDNKAYSEREITVFQDFLARDQYNFGNNRSCDYDWKAVAHYGVKESDLPKHGRWNCHGSVLHAAENTGSGNSTSTVSWRSIAAQKRPDSAWWSSLPLGRGDVIAYYNASNDGTLSLQHSNICVNSATAWGANNEPPSFTESWKWYACSPKAYYDKASLLFVNYVKVLRK